MAREQISDEDLDAIVEIAKRRAALIERLEQACLAHDMATVYEIARQVCGLEEEVKQ